MGELDHETTDTYTLTVIATDTGGRTDTVQVIINVRDVPEIAMFPVNSADLFVYEGSAGQKVLDPTGALIATDGDKQPLTFTLSGGPETSFNINRASFDRNTGVSQAQLTTKVPLDHATPAHQSFTGTVTASDGTGEARLAVTITLWAVTETGNVATTVRCQREGQHPHTAESLYNGENAVAKIHWHRVCNGYRHR